MVFIGVGNIVNVVFLVEGIFLEIINGRLIIFYGVLIFKGRF